MDAYHTEAIEHAGKKYRIDYVYDQDMGPPWEEDDGHGPVSDWTTRDKRPGELVLAENRHSKRYYAFQEAIAIAKRDGWAAPPYNEGTPGQKAERAVRADFEFLRAWCNDEWHWCGVVVTEIRKDADGFTYDGETASLWGIESSADDYLSTVAQELIAELAIRS